MSVHEPSQEPLDVLARRISQQEALLLISVSERQEFVKQATRLLGELPKLTSLTEQEVGRLLTVIADALFDVLDDVELETADLVRLIRCSSGAILFAAAGGESASAAVMFWDLALGAVPGHTALPNPVLEAVRGELLHLAASEVPAARESAAVGLSRLAGNEG